MDGLFQRDLPVSVALAGVTAQGPVQSIYCPRHRHLQVQGGRPPSKCQSEEQDKQKKYSDTQRQSPSSTVLSNRSI